MKSIFVEFATEVIPTVALVIIVMGALFLGLTAGFNAIVGPKECTNYKQETGRDTKWDFWGGCYVQSKGTWYTMAEYQSSIAAKDALTISDGE